MRIIVVALLPANVVTPALARGEGLRSLKVMSPAVALELASHWPLRERETCRDRM